MDLERTPEQEALATTVRHLLEQRAPVDTYVRPMLAEPEGRTPEVWSALADLGLMGLLVPPEHGGAGLGMVDMGVVLEELGRQLHPGPVLSSAVGAVTAVGVLGSPDDRAELLPALADGSLTGTVALFEAGRGGRWQACSTSAEHGDKETWLLSGAKCLVPDAASAGLVLALARHDGGVAMFALDPAGGGTAVRPVDWVDPTKKLADLAFDRAPARRLPGDAVSVVVDRILAARVAEAVGTASVALEIAVSYAKQRHQFGRPVGSFQAVAHLCSDMLQSVELSRAVSGYALWACDAAGPTESHRAATMAKAYAGDALWRVGASAIQVLGGMGCTWEHDAHLYYRRLLGLHSAHGTPAEHLEELARLVL